MASLITHEMATMLDRTGPRDLEPEQLSRGGRFMRSVAAQVKRTCAISMVKRETIDPKLSSPSNTVLFSAQWAAGSRSKPKKAEDDLDKSGIGPFLTKDWMQEGDDLDKSGIGPFITKDWMQEETDLIYSSLSKDVGSPARGGSEDVNSRRQAEEHETCTFLGRKRDSQRIGTPTQAVDCPWSSAHDALAKTTTF